VDVADVTSAIDAAQDGCARLPWRACNEEGERTLNAAGISVRRITTPEGTVPDTLDTEDLVAIAARAY
jgi:prolyl-tRNA synthetase